MDLQPVIDCIGMWQLCLYTAPQYNPLWYMLSSVSARAGRLQAQLDAAALKMEQQSAAAAKAVAEECERHVTAERALQQQVQQLTSELAVTQVRHCCR